MTVKPLLTAILVALAGPARAEDRPAAATDAHALARALPEPVLDRIRRRPAAYVEDAAELILSFGLDGGIGAAGIDESVLADRAAARARETERFLRADLDNDGRMTAAEVDGLTARTYQGWRGRLKVAQGQADRDGDGVISGRELAAHAEAAALAAVDAEAAARRMALMAFDLDRDGSVMLAEVIRGVEALAALDLAVVRKET